MKLPGFPTALICSALTMGMLAGVRAQEAPRGRGAGGQSPAAQQIPSSPPVDTAAHDRGRALWASHCIDCHGAQARGTETGPNIIRTRTVNFDRASFTPGSVLGPFLKAGHPTQSGRASASFTEDEVVGLAHFLRQRVNDTMRGSALFAPGDVLVGDARAGEAYFSGDGGCVACHNATTRDLSGIRSRVPSTVDLQQRMLFPMSGGRGRSLAGGAAAPNPNAIRVTVEPADGPEISGELVEESDFYVTIRRVDGTVRAIRRAPGMTVTTTNPLQAHVDLLDRITDEQIHDLVAYLETLR